MDLAETEREALRQLWTASAPVREGDSVDAYFKSLYMDFGRFLPEDIRTLENYGVNKVKDVRKSAAMIAMVRDGNGKPVTLHRTYLDLRIEQRRRLFPAPYPPNMAVRLCAYEGGVLGIACTIEEALAASLLFETPVWAVMTPAFMAGFTPPESCNELVLYADNDEASRAAAESARSKLMNRIEIIEIVTPKAKTFGGQLRRETI